MSKIREISENWNDLSWWPVAIKKFVTNRIIWAHYEMNKSKGIDVMDEDWDTLVILDACRYDMFEECNHIEGRLEHRYSKGSCTPDFLRENFSTGEFHDTVYVTANPMYREEQFAAYDIPGRFHATIDVYMSDWNDEYGTVEPAAVRDAAVDAFDEYPNKRHIVHYMQPHRPFIGDIGRQIENQRGITTRNKVLDASPRDEGERAWKLVSQNQIPVERAWEAYRENLELVLTYAEDVVNRHDGRRVITSDHGNLVDEAVGPLLKPWSGHPPRTWKAELVKVPWLIHEGTHRRTVTSEPPEADALAGTSVDVEERLHDLGYA